MKRIKMALSVAIAGLAGVCYVKQKRKAFGVLAVSAIGAGALIASPAYAQISQQQVMAYAAAMQTAANNQNIGQIARLLSDDVVVSLSRQGKGTTTLDKSAYLDLLQRSWTQATGYRYSIAISDVVITGDTARAQVITQETWVKDGKTTTLTTNSRATLGLSGDNAVLLRSVSQVAVE